jgi:hypothetical protein
MRDMINSFVKSVAGGQHPPCTKNYTASSVPMQREKVDRNTNAIEKDNDLFGIDAGSSAYFRAGVMASWSQLRVRTACEAVAI